jgi:NADH-quinone oxidoreductase subunit F
MSKDSTCKEIRDSLKEIIRQKGKDRGQLISILQSIQNKYHYLPEEALKSLSGITGITPSEIEGVASFYNQFRREPAGKHTIKVCIGTACHVKGAEQIYDQFKKDLGIGDLEDTDKEKRFTVAKVACLGCCMMAPAVQIDSVTYGFLDTQLVLRDFLENQKLSSEQLNRIMPELPLDKTGEIRICTCSSCQAAGAGRVINAFYRIVQKKGLPVLVKDVGCRGISYKAPFVEIVEPGRETPVYYGNVKPQDAETILYKHFISKNGLIKFIKEKAEYFIKTLYTGKGMDALDTLRVELNGDKSSFYWNRQKHVVLEKSGTYEPSSIQEYIQSGGFMALKKALAEPDTIMETIRKSGLRGRGGGGYLTALKWQHVLNKKTELKYIICNGDEGDPGAFMDRMILESHPYRVIEGIIIASIATGARQGIIYIRTEYPKALRTMEKAVNECFKRGFLGKDLSIRIAEGAGAFVCGEETALIAALEGKRGMPRIRPPYPSEKGYKNHPTLVGNVETFALVPWIILRGSPSFNSIGTHNSRGTKTFALAGKVRHGGLIEVPMGITIREIAEEIGGGIQGRKKFKAVQIGGPSGGIIPASMAHLPVDYEALTEAGAMMGSGGLVVLDETDCIVDIARYFVQFTQSESCGKCTFCRIGSVRMLSILERLCAGKGTWDDIKELKRTGNFMKKNSLCNLGRSAPNPVLTALRYFPSEFIAHAEGKCPSGKCKPLIQYIITDECIGCTLCAQNCPAEAIKAVPYQRHLIQEEKCIKCGTCLSVCQTGAVRVVSKGNL